MACYVETSRMVSDLKEGPPASFDDASEAARPRSNSYNFVPVRDFARPRGAPCPLLSLRAPALDRSRTLLLRLRDRMRLVETRSRDFSEDELFATKETLGQVYVDVSTKLAPDDFARDLRKLTLCRECVPCARRSACPAAFSPTEGDVFTRDDERVRAHLTTLRGRVLDVGAGEGVYLDTLAKAASEGAIDLVCVDPDSARLAMIASRYPFARCVAARAEDLGDDLGAFDHVLVLRSYNHLLDPSAVIGALVGRLASGGTLTLVDNVAFGLVRSASHAARAESAPQNELEHYRNEGSAEAVARVDRLLAAPRGDGRTLRLIERRDVGPDTSNQWLLRYECAHSRRHLE